MADFVDILSPSANAELEKANRKVLELISNMERLSNVSRNITMPSQSNNSVNNLNQQYREQERLIQSLQLRLERATQRNERNVERQRLAELRLQRQREQAFDRYERQLQREQQRLANSENLYNKIQSKLNTLSFEYKNLAAKKELGLRLTSEEEKRYNSLQQRIQNYERVLRGVDATMLRYQRHVGNYAGAFNPLSNSLNQITREMPAFANSVQTGFMAISNNLPIFFDALKQIRLENEELRRQGQQTQSVFKQLGSALFSWGTMLSLGVTLLTFFGPKMIESITNSKAKKEALEAEKKALEDKIKAEKDQNNEIATNISSEMNRSRILFEIAKNEEVSMKKRKEALQELRNRYGKYLTDLSDQKILAGQTAIAEERLNKALIGRGYALAAQSLLQKNMVKQMELYVEKLKRADQWEKYRNEDLKRMSTTAYNEVKITIDREGRAREQQESKRRQAFDKRTIEINKEMDLLKREENILLDLFKSNAKYLDSVNENTEAIEKRRRAKQKEMDLSSIKKGQSSLLMRLEEEKRELEEQQKFLSKNNIEWRMYQKLIDGVDKSIKQLTDTQDYLGESGKNAADDLAKLGEKMKAQDEAAKKMKKTTDEWLKNIQSGFLSNAGLGSLNFFLDIQENGLTMYEELMKGADPLAKKFAITFKGITDVAKEAFSFITQASQSAYNAELSNLEKRKEISLKYAGESATAREEIERQYEQRRKAIERQRAEQEKKQAIFNVIINTAQGISAVFAKTPPPKGIPLAALVAGIGALQLATISNAEVPNYEHGTDNHKGGLMLINDAKGSNYTEAVKTPDGRITKYKGRNVLVNAPKGTEVLTAQETLQFDKDLNNLLMNNGISQSVVNNGIDINDLDSVMGKYFRNIQVNNTTFDKDGISSFYMKNGQKTKTLDRIVTFKGFSV
jgi:hypothetical protein